MPTTTTRLFSPARVVALLLIALVGLGLAYLRFETGEERVSVPKGARAGDLVLEDCSYATEGGDLAADCGTLVVPEDRADPGSRLVALPVTRIRATSGRPAEPIFRLDGGPGITNMSFARASRFAERHDVVLVGYRGVDGSVRLDCPEVESALAHSTDLLGEKSLRAYADSFRACATRLSREGVDVKSYGLVQQVDDLEAARVALGYDRIDLLSESSGTRAAQIYAWRYPASIHRSVMVAVNPPGHYLWDAKTTDQQVGRYAALCARDDGCRARTDDLAATLQGKSVDVPARWLFLPVTENDARIVSFLSLMESSSAAAPASGPMAIDSWLSAADGDASGLWFASFAADLLFPKMVVWGQRAAVSTIDAEAARDYFASGWRKRASNLGVAATAFLWGGGRLAGAWPSSPEQAQYRRVRTSNVETLLVSGELDFATPPQAAREELLPHLPNGHQVLLPGFGHTVSFWEEQADAGRHLVNTFFDSGRVDDSLYRPQSVDLEPRLTHTVLGKGIAGTMIGVALLMVLSLIKMAVSARRGGRIGWKSGAFLRSVYPVVLGLGGWFLGLLIVHATLAGIPLDDELLTGVSIGLPIGLGVFLAWVRRERSSRSGAIGLSAAVGGALVGAWLGLLAAENLIAVLTTVLGATAGANLLLVAFDISWDREAHDPLAAPDADETPRSTRPHRSKEIIMSKLVAALVAALAAAALATVGAAATESGSFDVVMPKTKTTFVDIGSKGYSPGDYFLATGPVLDKAGGKRVGGIAGVWTLVGPSADDASFVLRLERGTVHVDGRIHHRKAPSVLRVVGGTGAYTGASGTATFRYLTETSVSLHVALG